MAATTPRLGIDHVTVVPADPRPDDGEADDEDAGADDDAGTSPGSR